MKKTKKTKDMTLGLSSFSKYIPSISQNIQKLRLIDRREFMLNARLGRTEKSVSRTQPNLARCKVLKSIGIIAEDNFGFLREARKLTRLQKLHFKVPSDTLPKIFKVIARLRTITEVYITIIPNSYYVDWNVMNFAAGSFENIKKKPRNLRSIKLDTEINFGFGSTGKIFEFLSWIQQVKIDHFDITLRITKRGFVMIERSLAKFTDFFGGLDSLAVCCDSAWNSASFNEYSLSQNRKGNKRLCLVFEQAEEDFDISKILSCCSTNLENLLFIDNANNLKISKGLQIRPNLRQLNVIFGHNNELRAKEFLGVLAERIKHSKKIESFGLKLPRINEINSKETLKFLHSEGLKTLKELTLEVGSQNGKDNDAESLLIESLGFYENLEKLKLNIGKNCLASILFLGPLIGSMPEMIKEVSLRIYGLAGKEGQIEIDTDLGLERLVNLEKLDLMLFGKFSEDSIQLFGKEMRIFGKGRKIEISYTFSEVRNKVL